MRYTDSHNSIDMLALKQAQARAPERGVYAASVGDRIRGMWNCLGASTRDIEPLLIFTALPGGSFNFDEMIDLSNGWLDCTHDARGQHQAGSERVISSESLKRWNLERRIELWHSSKSLTLRTLKFISM